MMTTLGRAVPRRSEDRGTAATYWALLAPALRQDRAPDAAARGTRLCGLSPKLPVRAYRWLRIRLPQPWSGWIARVAYLPRLAVGDDATRRELAEEPLIERLASTGEPLERVGAGFSERVVEIPWAMRRLQG